MLPKLTSRTECFTDFGPLNQAKFAHWWFSVRLEPIFDTAPAASKMSRDSKVVKRDQKIIISIPISEFVTHSL
jgi:hypothetical protein